MIKNLFLLCLLFQCFVVRSSDVRKFIAVRSKAISLEQAKIQEQQQSIKTMMMNLQSFFDKEKIHRVAMTYARQECISASHQEIIDQPVSTFQELEAWLEFIEFEEEFRARHEIASEEENSWLFMNAEHRRILEFKRRSPEVQRKMISEEEDGLRENIETSELHHWMAIILQHRSVVDGQWKPFVGKKSMQVAMADWDKKHNREGARAPEPHSGWPSVMDVFRKEL